MFPALAGLVEREPEGVGVLYVAPIKALLNNQEERLGHYTEMVGLRSLRLARRRHRPRQARFRQRAGRAPDDDARVARGHADLPAGRRVQRLFQRPPARRHRRGPRPRRHRPRRAPADRPRADRPGRAATTSSGSGSPPRSAIPTDPRVGSRAPRSGRESSSIRRRPRPKRDLAIHRHESLPALARRCREPGRGQEEPLLLPVACARPKPSPTRCAAGPSTSSSTTAPSPAKSAAPPKSASPTAGTPASSAPPPWSWASTSATSTASSRPTRRPPSRRSCSAWAAPAGVPAARRTPRSSARPDAVLQAVALIELARAGWVEGVARQERCWPVLVHQLLALTLQFGAISEERCWEQLARVPDFRGITRAEFAAAVEHMKREGSSSNPAACSRWAKPRSGRSGARTSWRSTPSSPRPQLYRVVTLAGRDLGSLEQDFVDRLVEQMSSFLLGGSAWTVERVTTTTARSSSSRRRAASSRAGEASSPSTSASTSASA